MAAEIAAPPPRTRWGVILLAVTAGIVIAFQIGKVPASIPTLQRALGLSLVDAGWVVSLLYGIAALLGLAAGAVADRLGARRVAVFGLLTAGVGSATGGLAGGLWPLLGSRLIEGVGAVSVLVTAPGLILRAVAPKDMRLAMGIWGTFMPAGIAIMLLLTPVLLAAVGWRGMWFVNAGLVAAFALWLWLGSRSIPDPPGDARRSARFFDDARAVAGRQGPWLLAGCFGIYAFSYLCVSAFLPKYLIDTYGWDEALAAVLTALAIAMNVVGNLVGGWLGHRGARRWRLVVLALATMGVMSWVVYQPWAGGVGATVAAFVFSGVGGLLPASVFGSVPLHAPARGRVASVNGLILQGTNIGQLIGPPLFAAIVAASTWATGPWLVVGVTAVGILLARRADRVERTLST